LAPEAVREQVVDVRDELQMRSFPCWERPHLLV
jgi:hypothetical protein